VANHGRLVELQALAKEKDERLAARARAAGQTAPSAPQDEGRRLNPTEPPTYAATKLLHLHRFPQGHTCPAGGNRRLLPVVDGAPSFDPHPESVDHPAKVSLVSVGDGFETTEVQTFPAPFTVVHGDSCQDLPRLELALSTSVASLSVNGTDVSVTLADLAARVQNLYTA